MNKKYILITIIIILNSLPILAQELLNDIQVNDTLKIEHYCWKNTPDDVEWRTILKSLKNKKKLEIGKIKKTPRWRLRNKNFIQIFAASLFENNLYTLEFNYGFIRINCLEFFAPKKFKRTTYAVDNHNVPTFGTSPICSGQILKIDNDIYFHVYISEERTPGTHHIIGIYILKNNHTLLEKVKIKYVDADFEFTDNNDFINNINNENFVRSEIEHITRKYIELQDFEYLGYFTTIPKKVKYSPRWDFYHFLYKADGKINFITYRINNATETNSWLISKDFNVEVIGY